MPVHCELRDEKYRICESDGTIAKTDNGKPRDGGGHETEQQCERQARAMNSDLTTISAASLVRRVNLSMKEPNSPVEIIYAGTFHLADRNMRLELSDEMVDEMVANFQKLDGPDRVVVNCNHNSDAATLSEARAVGWLQDLYAKRWKVDGNERYSLMGVPIWTDDAAEAISAEQFKYLSAEIDFHSTDTLSGDEVGCRLVGVALTNIPAIPKLAPVCLNRDDKQLKLEVTIARLSDKSIRDHIETVLDAFYRKFCDSNVEQYMVEDMFQEYLIVSVASETQKSLYRVDYMFDSGAVEFESRDNWITVEHQYAPVTATAITANTITLTTEMPIEGNTIAANVTEADVIIPTAATSGKHPEVKFMDESKIRELLGLSADADIEAELAALKARPTREEFDALVAERDALKQVPEDQEKATLTRRVATYESEMTKLAEQVAEFRAEKAKREAKDRIDLAMQSGKISPAELDAEDGYMRLMAETDPTTFDKVMATRPAKPELFRELGSSQDKPEATIDDLFRLIDEKMAANPNLSTSEARAQVFAERPDLVALTKKEG